jgi:hypothetical protein
MGNFRQTDRDMGFLLLPSVDERHAEKHLARFVVEVIDGLDLRSMTGSYRGSGSASCHPTVSLGILVYGYARGASRKLERATYDSAAFRRRWTIRPRSKPWPIAWRRPRARSSTPRASRRPNRVRHHQIGARLPAILAARPRQGPQRMEPRHTGLQHQAHVATLCSVRLHVGPRSSGLDRRAGRSDSLHH